MKKILLLILLNFCLSIIVFGQNEEPTIVLRPHTKMKDTTPKFVLLIKDYHLILDSSSDLEKLEINPDWIKKIRVLKSEASLSEAGYSDKNPIVLITLKKRSWKKLPKELRAALETSSE